MNEDETKYMLKHSSVHFINNNMGEKNENKCTHTHSTNEIKNIIIQKSACNVLTTLYSQRACVVYVLKQINKKAAAVAPASVTTKKQRTNNEKKTNKNKRKEK